MLESFLRGARLDAFPSGMGNAIGVFAKEQRLVRALAIDEGDQRFAENIHLRQRGGGFGKVQPGG